MRDGTMPPSISRSILEEIAHQSPYGSGLTIVVGLKIRAAKSVSLGRFYAEAEHFEDTGYIAGIRGQATAERGWREKTHWMITEAGRAALASEAGG